MGGSSGERPVGRFAGSTALWEADPEMARTAMIRHDLLTSEAVTASGGVLVRPRGEGDSHFAVFDHAADAIGAALRIR